LFADFNFKDTWIERVRTLYRIAKENGHRLLVVKLKDCYIIIT
jgi:hypothetical protein